MAGYRRRSARLECSVEVYQTKEQSKNEFSSTWTFGDITLEVEGRQLYASKSVLSMISPVFDAMFRDDFVEKKTSTVKLPGKKYTDVVEFLRCVHPHVGKNVTEDSLDQLLSLADEYQCPMLKTKCEEFLLQELKFIKLLRESKKSSSTFDGVLHWLRLADQFHLDKNLVEDLAKEVVIKADFVELKETDDYQMLGADCMRFVLSAFMNKMEGVIQEKNNKIHHLQMKFR